MSRSPGEAKGLGKAVQKARLRRAWSQVELAEEAGLSRPTIARIERGERVTTETIAKLAQALDLELQLREKPGERTRPRVALPDEDYTLRIGELAYAVSYLEWTLLGDLHRLSDRLPEGLTLAELEPCTTGTIAKKARAAAEAADDAEIQAYLSAAADALTRAAAMRNDLLHARPATHPQQDQRLNRAEVLERRTTGKRFWIDDAWFDESVEVLNEHMSAVSKARPPFE